MSELVSIIIPCFNQAHFVMQAVQSALEQEEARVEVVLVDDGSTDGLEQVLAPVRDHPALKYIRQENRGLPQARNRGIQESQGELLKFLDADDWLHPTVIRKQTEVLAQDPVLGFAYCDILHVDEQGHLQDDYALVETRQVLSGDILPSLLVGGYFPPHAVLIRRSVLEQVGYFDESLGGNADYELWLRVAAHGYRAQFLNERLVYYRRHANSMSRDSGHMRASRLRALEKTISAFPRRTAESLTSLFELNEELYQANRWIEQQRDDWQRSAGELAQVLGERERTIEEQADWIAHLEQVIREQQVWIAELEQGKAWLEQTLQEQQKWIAQLEEGKAWLEEQRDRWQQSAEEHVRLIEEHVRLAEERERLAEERERIIQEQQAYLTELEGHAQFRLLTQMGLLPVRPDHKT